MQPSKLNKRIEFYEIIDSVDEYGTPVTSENKVWSAWAFLFTQSIKDTYKTAGTSLENTMSFIIRSTKKFTPNTNQKVKYLDKFFEIKNIAYSSSTSDYLTITVKEYED